MASTPATQAPPSQQAPGLVGQIVADRYRVVAKLGEGGMGAVYQAEQISLKRRVALKVLRPELSAQPGLVRRFNAEAELAAKLNHPNTVTLYDFGQDADGALFIAMEFIQGQSLRELLVRQGPQCKDRIVHIASQICASLSDAHSTGIVHRDLKPDNVMLSQRGKQPDVVTVLDFGIAKLRDIEGKITQQPMTQAGDMLGTPQYMAPEQIRGDRVDARTDIYALGIILYELATSRLPFEATSVMAMLSKHLTEAPVPPRERRSDLAIDLDLEQLIMSCLAKSPDHRPASMDAVEEALERLAPAAGITIAPTLMAAPLKALAAQPLAQATPPRHEMVAQSQQPLTPPQSQVPSEQGNSEAVALTAQMKPKRPARRTLPLVLSLLAVAGGMAAYFALLAPSPEQTKDEGFDMSAWTDNSSETPVQAPYAQPAKPDVPAEAVPQKAALKKQPEAKVALYPSNHFYRDSTFTYSFDLPRGFQGRGDGMGNASFSGDVHGHKQTIITMAWSEPGNFNEGAIEQALAMHLSMLGLRSSRLRWKSRRGHRVLLGKVRDPGDDEEGDFVLFRRGPTFFFVIVATAADHYAASRRFRRTFFEKHYRVGK